VLAQLLASISPMKTKSKNKKKMMQPLMSWAVVLMVLMHNCPKVLQESLRCDKPGKMSNLWEPTMEKKVTG
jgi:hypothetical protein